MSGTRTALDTRTPEEVGASAMKKAIWRLGPFLGCSTSWPTWTATTRGSPSSR